MRTIYTDVLKDLNGKQSRKVAHNTYLQVRDPETIALRYHATDVVTYHADGRVVLDTGGWRTSTTKLRFNESYARLPIRGIYANRGVWYVDTGRPQKPEQYRLHCYSCSKSHTADSKDSVCPRCHQPTRYSHELTETVPFDDGLTLQLNGDGLYHVVADTIGEDPKKTQKLRRKVQAYAAGFIAAMRAGKVTPPGAGDCLYCQLRTKEGNTMGELAKDTSSESHIRLHMQEKYYVGSLLVRAIEVMPCSQVMRWTAASAWGLLKDETGNVTTFAGSDYEWQSLQKILARYILRQLGEVS